MSKRVIAFLVRVPCNGCAGSGWVDDPQTRQYGGRIRCYLCKGSKLMTHQLSLAEARNLLAADDGENIA